MKFECKVSYRCSSIGVSLAASNGIISIGSQDEAKKDSNSPSIPSQSLSVFFFARFLVLVVALFRCEPIQVRIKEKGKQ